MINLWPHLPFFLYFIWISARKTKPQTKHCPQGPVRFLEFQISTPNRQRCCRRLKLCKSILTFLIQCSSAGESCIRVMNGRFAYFIGRMGTKLLYKRCGTPTYKRKHTQPHSQKAQMKARGWRNLDDDQGGVRGQPVSNVGKAKETQSPGPWGHTPRSASHMAQRQTLTLTLKRRSTHRPPQAPPRQHRRRPRRGRGPAE